MPQPFSILYSTQDISKSIASLLGNPPRNDQRILLVAYLGKDAPVYLPSPKGIKIICSPTPGFTNGKAILDLKRRGAEIQFSDNLHMKVYWSKVRGCIITSANLSKHALGQGGLREAGVLLSPGVVDVDRFIKEANPYEIDTPPGKKKMKKLLDVATHWEGTPNGKNNDFSAWYADKQPKWKLGWWEDESHRFSPEAMRRAKREYGTKPQASIIFAEGQAKQKGKEWFLSFKLNKRGGDVDPDAPWLWSHFTEKVLNEKAYPYEAVQCEKLDIPQPPFRILKDFKEAFRAATKEYGIEKIKELPTLVPRKELLKLINQCI